MHHDFALRRGNGFLSRVVELFAIANFCWEATCKQASKAYSRFFPGRRLRVPSCLPTSTPESRGACNWMQRQRAAPRHHSLVHRPGQANNAQASAPGTRRGLRVVRGAGQEAWRGLASTVRSRRNAPITDTRSYRSTRLDHTLYPSPCNNQRFTLRIRVCVCPPHTFQRDSPKWSTGAAVSIHSSVRIDRPIHSDRSALKF